MTCKAIINYNNKNYGGGDALDFHSKDNMYSYTNREADAAWKEKMKALIDIHSIHQAADIGCGGGIYSKALADIGIPSVSGVDYSKPILAGAMKHCSNYSNISFQPGYADDTGLESDSADLILSRALIHHIKDLGSVFAEAYRILKSGGCYIIQDRTLDDCLLQGSNEHIRGYFFEAFPKLKEFEKERRHSSDNIKLSLQQAGFKKMEEHRLWEIRKTYKNKQALLDDIQSRAGRSILHELSDTELAALMNYIDQSIGDKEEIVEKDRWTLFKAIK
ncbi:class I SAM-dependent methyltransferase [Oceanobacillus sojae]|uniref:class I SAM-dependent methyltransferase n=1 Tax=Oceanobacillus sojae TaxID=582851 RepID=UPI0021A45E70|nr:class I SAM-dependent methyltransferase [Oceanobacillus sojae]MCT1905224.1 class I SAM-dependent methyltransferase [Oceanobacillus sojae]